jgi:hypothetical protein
MIIASTKFLTNPLSDVASILAAIEKLQRPLEGKADEERIIYDG